MLLDFVFTGSIARGAKRRYLSYSPEAHFEVFRPTDATPMGVKFDTADGTEGWDRRSPPPCQISSPWVQLYGYRTPKTEIFIEI